MCDGMKRTLNRSPSLAFFAVAGLLAALNLGCVGVGEGEWTLTIATQPANVTVPLGQNATFTVIANGPGPLTYQWSENGMTIPGAITASYTTTPVNLTDSGATFTVIVRNKDSSLTSNPATLTVGPRSPEAGDLRFQLVDSPAEANQDTGNTVSPSLIGDQELFFGGATGSPLTIGDNGSCVPDSSPANCVWTMFATSLPQGQSGLNAYFESGVYSNFSSDLNSNFVTTAEPADSPNNVILSLDLEPAYNAYAMYWMQTTQGGPAFDLKREVVAPTAVAETVAADAAASRVITAVSFDANGQANLLSYGWQGDTTTVYDTQVVTAAGADVVNDATALAGEGYILTAFGGDVTDGFVLVGTKVHGDTISRPILVGVQFANGSYTSHPYPLGTFTNYAPVAWPYYLNADGTIAGISLIYEK